MACVIGGVILCGSVMYGCVCVSIASVELKHTHWEDYETFVLWEGKYRREGEKRFFVMCGVLIWYWNGPLLPSILLGIFANKGGGNGGDFLVGMQFADSNVKQRWLLVKYTTDRHCDTKK